MTRSMTFAAATRAALQTALDDDAVLLGDTVGRPGSPTEGLEGDVIALPSGDRGSVGVGLGMALAGRKVIVSLPSAARLASVAEILVAAGQAAQEHPVRLVVHVAYGGELPGLDAPVGRALAPVPGAEVWCSASPGREASLLLAATQRPGPTVLLSPRALATTRGPVDLAPGEAAPRVVRDGTHVTLAAWGAGVRAASRAAEALDGEGVSAMVVDLAALWPLPEARLGELVRHTGRLVVAHPDDDVMADHVRAVGLHRAFLHLESPLAQVPARAAPIARAARDAVFY